MSITACRSVRNWFLPEVKGIHLNICLSFITTRHSGGGPFGVLEDVALAVARGELEGEGGVVALQHGRVVVQDGQLAPGVAQEGVGSPWVVHVVHRGCYQSGYFIQLVQTALKTSRDRATPSVPDCLF